MVMTYGHVYVARVAMGGNDTQTVKAFREAEAYAGPSLIVAYSHCIAHGYDLRFGMDQQRPPSFPATGPSSATIPTWRRRAAPCSSIPSRRVCP